MMYWNFEQFRHAPSEAVIKNAQAVNALTTAVADAMTGKRKLSRQDEDTLFFGGVELPKSEKDVLADFTARMNWNLIYVGCMADSLRSDRAEIAGIGCYVTDGIEATAVLGAGKLWKASREARAVIVFPATGIKIRLSRKGQLLIDELSGPPHDHGFELAREAVVSLQDAHRDRLPVVSVMGRYPIVSDVENLRKGGHFG